MKQCWDAYRPQEGSGLDSGADGFLQYANDVILMEARKVGGDAIKTVLKCWSPSVSPVG